MGANGPTPTPHADPALPRVSILCHDVSSNALGRSLVLADLLRGATDVEILGVSSRPEIWAPALGTSIPIRRGPVVSSTRDLRAARQWLARVSRGDLLLISKAI